MVNGASRRSFSDVRLLQWREPWRPLLKTRSCPAQVLECRKKFAETLVTSECLHLVFCLQFKTNNSGFSRLYFQHCCSVPKFQWSVNCFQDKSIRLDLETSYILSHYTSSGAGFLTRLPLSLSRWIYKKPVSFSPAVSPAPINSCPSR